MRRSQRLSQHEYGIRRSLNALWPDAGGFKSEYITAELPPQILGQHTPTGIAGADEENVSQGLQK